MLTVSNRTLDKLRMCFTERVFAKNRTAEWSLLILKVSDVRSLIFSA